MTTDESTIREPISNNSDLTLTSRRALLNYYNSQTMTHGGYTIALIVGIFVLISRWDVFYPDSIKYFWIMVIAIILLLFYCIGRSLYWGSLATKVTSVNLNEPKNKKEEDYIKTQQSRNVPSTYILHDITFNRVRKTLYGKIFSFARRTLFILTLIFIVASVIILTY